MTHFDCICDNDIWALLILLLVHAKIRWLTNLSKSDTRHGNVDIVVSWWCHETATCIDEVLTLLCYVSARSFDVYSFEPKRNQYYRKTSGISRTKFQSLIVSYILLQLSSLNPLKPGFKLRMKM